MKLYQSLGPNPMVVRIFIAEKGMAVPRHQLDVMKQESRGEEYLKINPVGQSPALVLDSGLAITETTAICSYLEELQPSPPLFGSTPEERAEALMWSRRVTLLFTEPLTHSFCYGEFAAMMGQHIRIVPEGAEGIKAVAQDGLKWFEAQLNGDFLAGSRFTVADIQLLAFLQFIPFVRPGEPLEGLPKLFAWRGRVVSRPAVATTLAEDQA